MKDEEQFEMIAKTLYGLEDVLAEELTLLNAGDVKAGRRMVSFKGDKTLMYKANFCCRTALRILKPICRFKAEDADTVYSEVKKIEWDQYFTTDMTFASEAVIYSETFTHSMFVAYKVKDAIADFFNEKYGKRPSVRINRPDMYIHIHISHHDCTVSLDSSGESLHKRGYRAEPGEAPLNEVLAAGMILKTGWHGESNFVDPMCGSGTLLIEAAMIALNVPPGIYRKEYAFERWGDFDRELFTSISEDETEERVFAFKCFGSDMSPQALQTAEKNVENAGLSQYIELKLLSFQQYTEAPRPGILITNPPYGERIPVDDLMGLYGLLGERLKHVFTGYQAWILSYKEECLEKIGLRPDYKVTLMNGQLECEYRCYKLFEGKNKEYKKTLNEQKPFDRKGDSSSDAETPFSRKQYPSGDKPFRKPYSQAEDRPSGNRPSFSDDRPPRKSYPPREDRPSWKQSSYGNDRPSGNRPFSDDRPPRKSYPPREDRPSWKQSSYATDRPSGNRPSFSDDRPPRKSYPPRDDRPSWKQSSYGNDRPSGNRPPFSDDRPPRKSYPPREDRPSWKQSSYGNDRPPGNRPPFSDDRPPRKSYPPREDRPSWKQSSYGNDRPPGKRPSFSDDRPPRKTFRKRK
jgi:putative N6-adenine-specific DNA methylase